MKGFREQGQVLEEVFVVEVKVAVQFRVFDKVSVIQGFNGQ